MSLKSERDTRFKHVSDQEILTMFKNSIDEIKVHRQYMDGTNFWNDQDSLDKLDEIQYMSRRLEDEAYARDLDPWD